MSGRILGISAFYHDAAAALVVDGRIIAAAQEERFSRLKHDAGFPRLAIAACLHQGGLTVADLDEVVFYDKPIQKFSRLLETYLAIAPAGLVSFPRILPSWLSEKLDLRRTIRAELPGLRDDCRLRFTAHHQAHAASCFYPSPFRQAAILTVDGVGEWATTMIAAGEGHRIESLAELRFPHSLGLLYTAFTVYCGFRPNSGEYKLMGLAPYGRARYAAAIREHLVDLKADGSFRLNLDYFDYVAGLQMTNRRFHDLFGGPPRVPESPLESRHSDLAASIQEVTNEMMLGLARQAKALTGHTRLCLAGGVALNCVANGVLQRSGLFERCWIQPAAGDAGGALGAALAAWHGRFDAPAAGEPRATGDKPDDDMQGALLGPEFSDAEIARQLDAHQAVYEKLDREALLARTVEYLTQEKVVGWFQGRMEYGPRALGGRSILADPRSTRMQSELNLKVKFRESFRPFAPVVRWERARDYFELDAESPYMLVVAPVRPELRLPENAPAADMMARVRQVRSQIPAVTHVDYSARIQTVRAAQNPLLHALLEKFDAATGCGVLVNTSLNVRGEPVVASPDDAYRCLINTRMDALVIGSYVLEHARQPHRSLANSFHPFAD